MPTLNFPGADLDITVESPQHSTRLTALARHHLSGIRTALQLGSTGAVRTDVAFERAAEQLEKLAMLLASGACYEEAPSPLTPAEEVAVGIEEARREAGIDGLLDDREPVHSHDRDHRHQGAA